VKAGANGWHQWHEGRIEQGQRLALLGANNEEMARVMLIPIATLEYWMRTKPGFRQAVEDGKMDADAKVANALFRRAIGYDYTEEVHSSYKGVLSKITVRRHSVPDTWAAFKWLTSRQRSKWTDVTKVESTQTNINIAKLDLSGLNMEELKLVKRVQLQQLTENAGDTN
jgi:hypothetical protein